MDWYKSSHCGSINIHNYMHYVSFIHTHLSAFPKLLNDTDQYDFDSIVSFSNEKVTYMGVQFYWYHSIIAIHLNIKK